MQALRNLMKSTPVDNDQAVDNIMEIFRQACAESFAKVTDYCMIHKLHLYAAFIVYSTLSSASYYQFAEARQMQ
jgi:ABC-type arginine/histidine transport system permease subunit